MENAAIIEKLNRKGGRLSKSHRKLAAFIAEHYDTAVYMTAARLAEVVDISESTVVRFATALGYDGYPEMQATLREIVRHRLTNAQRLQMRAEMSIEDSVSMALSGDIRNIRTTLDQLDIGVFKQVVEVLSTARTIYVLGMRSAAPLASFFAHYLQYIFDGVRFINPVANDVFETISRISEEDTLFAISYPRYSNRTLEAMAFARSRGAKVLALTDGPLSPLFDASDLCLVAQTEMASFADSMAAPMSLINALLAALGVRNREMLNRNFSKLEEIWDKFRIYANKE